MSALLTKIRSRIPLALRVFVVFCGQRSIAGKLVRGGEGRWPHMERQRKAFEMLVTRAGVTVSVIALLSACSGHSSDVDSSKPLERQSAPAQAATTASPSTPSSAAIKTYRAMWTDAAKASKTTDAKHPRLDDHASGAALLLLRHMMKVGDGKGEVARGAPKPDPWVKSADAKKVVLIDCLDSTRWISYDEKHPSSSPHPGSRHRTDATVQFKDGRWTVTELYLHAGGSC